MLQYSSNKQFEDSINWVSANQAPAQEACTSAQKRHLKDTASEDVDSIML